MTLKQKLHRGEAVYGTMLRMIRNPAIIPIAKESGLDFVMFDLEHGAYSLETLADMAMMGRCHGLPVCARLPELSRAWVSGALDAGLEGVMVPMIETGEQARQLVQWSKYAPLGRRGYALSTANTMYQRPADAEGFLRECNDRILTIAQIETVAGMESAAAIAGTPGVDVILVGPTDLAASLGKPGQLDTPEEIEAIGRIARAVADAGVTLGVHTGDEMIQRMVPMGLRFFMSSIDVVMVSEGMAEVNAQMRSRFAKLS